MELQFISAEEKALLRPLKKLYKSAFPRCERKPFALLLKNRREGKAEILAALDENGEFCGLAILHSLDDLMLLAYFAVIPSARGRGIGSELLRLLHERFSDRRFFLEIELPDPENDPSGMKNRRKDFYLRNGMNETGLFVRLFGVELEILSFRCAVSFEEYFKLYRSVTGKIVEKNLFPLDTEER